MNAITLFEHPSSPYAQKVRLLLREKNIPFTSTLVEGMGSGADDPELRRLNPRREIPVIKVDGENIFDSTIILEYLEEKFPTPTLMPAEPLARADAYD
ncbi:glutathione S-transferase family protein [Candidatus Sodalis pierantonius]|uniref:glutathione S-transferase family protein n=1 Tax=Candidatus Sodalis pierantonii TaxID=1486991 RepID=UPI000687B518|nr:glutathione S-transferase family protein [Candidatus Sodalis pierantonius]